MDLTRTADSSDIHLLLVDDNQFFLGVLKTLLQRQANMPIMGEARDGESALVQAGVLQPHVVLVDLTLPGLSGLETIARLRALLPGVGIIALTLLLDDPACRAAVLASGADEVVRKSRLTTDLPPAIRLLGLTKFNSKNCGKETNKLTGSG